MRVTISFISGILLGVVGFGISLDLNGKARTALRPERGRGTDNAYQSLKNKRWACEIKIERYYNLVMFIVIGAVTGALLRYKITSFSTPLLLLDTLPVNSCSSMS